MLKNFYININNIVKRILLNDLKKWITKYIKLIIRNFFNNLLSLINKLMFLNNWF